MRILDKEAQLRRLRQRREEECFSIINRGKLWYNTLTSEQLGELNSWYRKWLDITETCIIPQRPNWIDGKVKKEEITL